MKNVILMVSSIIFGILTLSIVMTVYGRMVRSMELKSNLPSLIESSFETLLEQEEYMSYSVSEFFESFAMDLSAQWENESDMRIDVWQFDPQKGIMAIKATAQFLKPNGKYEAVECDRMVIFNKLCKEELPEQYGVTFIVGGELYKAYSVQEGTIIAPPVNPSGTDVMFYGWLDEEGKAADIAQPISQNLVYYADMR